MKALLLALALCTAAGVCACGSTSHGAGGDGTVRVELRDYRSGENFVLVSGDDEERLKYYSERRDDASTKFQTAEIMNALLKHFDKNHLDSISVPGSASPYAQGASGATKSLQVTRGGETRHALRLASMRAEDARDFHHCVEGFLAVYTNTYALQSVESETSIEFEAAVKQGNPRD